MPGLRHARKMQVSGRNVAKLDRGGDQLVDMTLLL
jgi:hypothetical protein